MEEEEEEYSEVDLEAVDTLLAGWNDFVKSLLKAEKLWNGFVETTAVVNKPLLQLRTPPTLQKMIGLFGRERFTVALPRMVDYWRGYGGLEMLLIKEEKGKEG